MSAGRTKPAGKGALSFDHRELDELLSSRLRLAVMSVLLGCDKADFVYLRDAVKATDGNLTAHCKKLENAAYIRVEKKFVNRKPVTFYSIRPEGKKALIVYAEKLTGLISSTEPAE